MNTPKRSMVHGQAESKRPQARELPKTQTESAKPSKNSRPSALAQLPSVDRLLKHPALIQEAELYGSKLLSSCVKSVLAEIRHSFSQNLKTSLSKADLKSSLDSNLDHSPAPLGPHSSPSTPHQREMNTDLDQTADDGDHLTLNETLDDALIIARVKTLCVQKTSLSFKRVFNMSGTVIHTNLGRSVLPKEATQALADMLGSPLNLEFDLGSGARGERDTFVEELICELTGAEAATFVNNNAAAVLLTIAALAKDKEVLISRGEQVEIGGAFRMPDVISSAGAIMKEVGTTNRTHLSDYERAIGPCTSLIMKIHTSNYEVQGFTKSVSEADLALLCKSKDIALATDLGSGSLLDMRAFGLPHEPMPSEMLKCGCDVVTFSGDKLLGGPQAGIIVGTKKYIDLIRRHPMKRALRLSKLPLLALEATLKLYLQPERLKSRLPTLRWLTRDPEQIMHTAQTLAPVLENVLLNKCSVAVVEMLSQIGSGSLPVDLLPSFGVELRPILSKGETLGSTLNALMKALRALPTPVIGRIEKDTIRLDCRCIESGETLEELMQTLSQLSHLSSQIQSSQALTGAA